MATKKSLVEVTHDDGYGDSLLMHINSAFGGKDMRADKIVNPVAPAMQIEGIPDGWEFVRVGRAKPGEFFLDNLGGVCEYGCSYESASVNYIIIRKIEKPKQHRPFANAEEFEPHRDRWFRTKSDPVHRIKTSAYDDKGHWGGVEFDTWKAMFDSYEFEDGTPFGIEVVE